MNRTMTFTSVILALTWFSSGVSHVALGDERVLGSAETVVATVEAAMPFAADRDAVVTRMGDSVSFTHSDAAVRVALDPNGNVELRDSLDLEGLGVDPFAIALPSLDLERGKLVNDAVVYESESQPVAIAVQPVNGGAQLSILIENPTAPQTFAFQADLPPDATLELDTDTGWVVARRQHGSPAAYIAPPWARDATGAAVPTHFDVKDGQVVQIVEHTDEYQYPIVADPYLGKSLIKSAVWTWEPRSKSFGAGWTLRVTVTEWAWEMSASPVSDLKAAAGKYGWDELRAKYAKGAVSKKLGRTGSKPLNRYLTPLRDQYLCHAEYAALYYGSRRPTWNLDEWRKDVGYLSTVRYRCNPPAGGPYRF